MAVESVDPVKFRGVAQRKSSGLSLMSPLDIWGCSSAGRAPALQAGGQEFDPPQLHVKSLL